jgi:hypothetical protein
MKITLMLTALLALAGCTSAIPMRHLQRHGQHLGFVLQVGCRALPGWLLGH